MRVGILARMPIRRSFGRSAAQGPVVVISLLVALAACDSSATPSSSLPGSSDDPACSVEEIAEGGIDGRVVDTAGNPLNDILIQIRTTDGFRGMVRTGEDGVFSAPGVSGDFQMTTTDIDHDDLVREVTVPCGELVEVELVLTPVDS